MVFICSKNGNLSNFLNGDKKYPPEEKHDIFLGLYGIIFTYIFWQNFLSQFLLAYDKLQTNAFLMEIDRISHKNMLLLNTVYKWLFHTYWFLTHVIKIITLVTGIL
jgi:hypothetical protein